MPVVVAMLRGINVGGAGKLPMAQLREVIAGRGYDDVRTYIQSGNVVCRSPLADTDAIADDLRRAVRSSTGLDPEVHVRTVDELEALVAGNPFVDRATDPKQLHVAFVRQLEPVELDAAAYEPEAWATGDRALYLFLPNGIGRSKLATDLTRRHAATGTTRNWRTTTTLLDMARELADPSTA